MPGVGKTVLVREIARQAMEERFFDAVIMATVGDTPDIRIIQSQIAEMLGLKLEEQSMMGRAARLHHRLNKEKRILIVLDDIWSRLDLVEVGIPFQHEHRGCKILLTSRNRNVLDNEMDVQESFAVNLLTQEEAWNLFKKIAGDSVEAPDLRPIATMIAKECGGLPLAIATVGRALRNKSLFAWMEALNSLRKSSSPNSAVYSTLELSYNRLESEELQLTFLLSSQMGGDALILDLMKCAFGLGIFVVRNSIEETLNAVFACVSQLKASSLLIDSYSDERFDMHDIVRDAARHIGHMIALKDKEILGEWQNGETMKDWTSVSLECADIAKLPDKQLECPQLASFFMACKNPHLEIPINFFNGMHRLKVLCLTGMRLSLPPSSISLLIELRTLCLHQCVLGNVAVFGELKNLEILSLTRSDIEALPSETGKLLKLKLLDLSNCAELKVIPSNVLSGLSGLEDLRLGDSSIQWKSGGEETQRSRASLTELKHLLRLSTLDIHIRDDRIMPKDLFLACRLERFKIFIGEVWEWSGKLEYSRTMKLKLNTSIHLHQGVKKLLESTQDLYLDELKGVINVLPELNKKGFPALKYLHVHNNSEILYIVSSVELHPLEAFPGLESFFLHNLLNLKKICHGQLEARSFSSLKIIKVGCCGSLTNLLSFSIAKGLLRLQELEITDCKNMKDVVFQDREEEISEIEATGEIKFPLLRFLTLQHLPSLLSFCIDEKTNSTSQQSMIGTSSRPITLFDEKLLFPELEDLKLCSLSIQLLWHNQLPTMSSCAGKLTTLIIEGCHNLTYIFSPIMANSLSHLRSLEICNCMSLEEVIVNLADEESIDQIVLPQLVSLGLHALPRFKRFCHGNHVEFLSLKELSISNCPVLKPFISSSVTGSMSPPLFDDQVAIFPSLEKLVIIEMQNLEEIWHSCFTAESFYNLKYLEVGLCGGLLNVFPVQMVERLQTLNELRLYNCDSLEVIVAPQELNTGESDVVAGTQSIEATKATEFLFSSVACLQLYMLPRLQSFYPGLHTTKWPSLQKIEVFGCDKVQIFASEFSSFQEAHMERHLEMSQQPLFCVDEVAFPSLEELWLEENAIMEKIWLGQLPAVQNFPRLKVMKLMRLPKQTTILSSCFQTFSFIPKLIVSDASFSEIFQWGELDRDEKHPWTLDKLHELSLSKLPELTNLWKGRFEPKSVFLNLKTLNILGCERLKRLLPSSVSFQNLMTLKVSKCHGLQSLMTCSTANSMEQLRIISITDCKVMEEIIAHEDDEAKDDIVIAHEDDEAKDDIVIAHEGDEVKDDIALPKLKYLGLQSLPSLTSFCSGKDTINLPSLDELIVRECPKLENFSRGESVAPVLQKVHLIDEEDSGCWVSNLDATIKNLHTKKNHVKELGTLQWKLSKMWVTSV